MRSRTWASLVLSSAMACSRPIKLVSWMGRLCALPGRERAVRKGGGLATLAYRGRAGADRCLGMTFSVMAADVFERFATAWMSGRTAGPVWPCAAWHE